MTAPLTTVVFDLGGVLLDWNPDYLYRKLIPDEKERRDFLTHVCSQEWNNQHDLGVTFADNATELEKKYPHNPRMQGLIRAYGDNFQEMFAGTIRGSVEILTELSSAGVPVYALTNMAAEALDWERQKFPFYALFKDIIVSGVEHIKKPDPRIYQLLLDRTKIDPHSAIYIDDRAENLPPAAALGFTTILLTTPEALRAELIRHNLPLL